MKLLRGKVLAIKNNGTFVIRAADGRVYIVAPNGAKRLLK
jgi:urease accessory protein UreE